MSENNLTQEAVWRCPLEEAFIAGGQCQDAPEDDTDDVFIPPVFLTSNPSPVIICFSFGSDARGIFSPDITDNYINCLGQDMLRQMYIKSTPLFLKFKILKNKF